MENTKPFRDLKVLELASVLAGPLVGTFFAELGAEVTKIENSLTGGDITRQWKLPGENADSPLSAYYLSANWGKKSIFLDLNQDPARTELLSMLEKTDILLVNFKPGDAEKFGLDWKKLAPKFPKLIYAHITGYGLHDPRLAFDLSLQAESGFMSMNGTSASGPLKMPVALIDLLAAHQVKEGILAALYTREKTGKGALVSVSLLDSALASLANQGGNFLLAGNNPSLNGSLHPNIAPYGETFRCSDGRFLVLAVGNDKQFANLCKACGFPELVNDNRFMHNTERVRNRSELQKILEPYFLQDTAHQISVKFQSEFIPCSVVKTVAEALTSPYAKALFMDTENGKTIRTAVFNIKNEDERE